MRITLDARLYKASRGGIGRYSQELIKNLIAIDTENHYTAIMTAEDAEECRVVAPNFTKVVTDIVHFSFAEQLRLPQLLAQTKPDLVHFLNFNHPLTYTGKYITTVHDLTMNFFPVARQKELIRRQAYLAVMRHAASGADAVIVPTETVKQDVVTHLHAKPDTVFVTYEGVDIPDGAYAKPKKEYLATLGITKPYIFFLSQWRPHKGLGMLIEAFDEIKKTHDIQLVAGGKASEQFPEIPAAVAASAHRSDIVTPGFIDDELLNILYAGAELFVFPSWYEGFGLPPLEAMARGTAVASSNMSVMPEVLGAGAAYFDPKDPASIAQTIVKILDDETYKKDLQTKGLAQAKKYSWKKMAEETLAIYQKVGAT